MWCGRRGGVGFEERAMQNAETDSFHVSRKCIETCGVEMLPHSVLIRVKVGYVAGAPYPNDA